MHKLTYIILLVVLSKSYVHSAVSKTPPKKILISGKIRSDLKLTDSLYLAYWENYTYMTGNSGVSRRRIAVGPNNTFKFYIPTKKSIGRVNLSGSEIGNIMNLQCVEAGDSIFIDIKYNGYNDFLARYSGKGSEKYNIATDIAPIRGWSNAVESKNLNRCKQIYDSLLSKRMQIARKYRSNIPPNINTILQYDLTSELDKDYLNVLFATLLNKEFKNRSEFLSNFTRHLNITDTADGENKSLSPGMIDYCYTKAKLKQILIENKIGKEEPASFYGVFNTISSSYNGILREKLLAYLFSNSWEINTYYNGINSTDFTNALIEAISISKQPENIEILEFKLETIGKGAPAYNFSLPDESGKLVKISDLKGKVILLDIWSNPCGGCLHFKKEFLKSVYPNVKTEKDFLVISIGTNKEKQKWLSGIKQYSHESFLNVYTDGLGDEHPLVKHYNVTIYPTLILIGKSGKIFSATVPYLREGELLTQIQSALSEPN